MKLGCRHKYLKARVALIHYSNHPSTPSKRIVSVRTKYLQIEHQKFIKKWFSICCIVVWNGPWLVNVDVDLPLTLFLQRVIALDSPWAGHGAVEVATSGSGGSLELETRVREDFTITEPYKGLLLVEREY